MAADIIRHETPGMWALRYAAQGWHVFPVKRGSKVPQIGGGKGFKDASSDPAQVQQWWNRWPKANIGIATGAVSGIVVLDVDLYHAEAEESLSRLEAQYGSEHAHTLMARTGGGGLHLFFRHPGGGVKLKSRARLLPGLDTRADGGYVVAAPSVHESGAFYRWLNFGDEILPLPEWLRGLIEQAPAPPDVEPSPIRRFEPTSEDATFWLRKALDKVNSGEYREPTGFWLATMLRDAGIDEAQAQPVMIEYADSVPFTGHAYDPREALSSLRSAYRQPAREPAKSAEARGALALKSEPRPERPQLRTVPRASEHLGSEPPTFETLPDPVNMTDTGNAKRLVARHGENLRYCYAWRKWLTWDGRRWATDDTGEIIRRAQETVRSMLEEAAHIDDDNERKQMVKHIMRSEAEKSIRAMVALAQAAAGVAITPDELDAHQWHLNVANGVLDLRTGTLEPHSRDALHTKIVPIAYDPDATCPTFERFLYKVMDGNKPLIAFLQRAIGYALTGSTREQVLFLLHGKGRNGKSTLLEIIRELLSGYAMQTPTETLMQKRGESGVPNDIARLKGARFVCAVEGEEGQKLAEALVKQLTGQDQITARFMRAEWFEFKPEFKIFLASNHKPMIRGSDDGIWRRIRMIPFTVQIAESEKDDRLPEKLRAELPGILAWAVRGCMAWQRDGLGMPEEVKAATDSYRAEMDVIGEFLDQHCTLDRYQRVPIKDLYATYKAWCDSNGEFALSQRIFGSRLRDRGFEQDKGTAGVRIWKGISLNG